MSMSVYLSASRNEETYPDKCKIGYALSLWGMYLECPHWERGRGPPKRRIRRGGCVNADKECGEGGKGQRNFSIVVCICPLAS